MVALSCIAVEAGQEIKPSQLLPRMTEQIELEWLIIQHVRCTGPTLKHKHTVGHIPESSISASSIYYRYRTTTGELQRSNLVQVAMQ